MENGNKKGVLFIVMIIIASAIVFEIVLIVVNNDKKSTETEKLLRSAELEFADRVIVFNDYLTINSLVAYVHNKVVYFNAEYNCMVNDENYETCNFVYAIEGNHLNTRLNLDWDEDSKQMLKEYFDSYNEAKEKGISKIYTKEQIKNILLAYDGKFAADGNSKEELIERH